MTMNKERVQGIGGLFFRSRDPKALAECTSAISELTRLAVSVAREMRGDP